MGTCVQARPSRPGDACRPATVQRKTRATQAAASRQRLPALTDGTRFVAVPQPAEAFFFLPNCQPTPGWHNKRAKITVHGIRNLRVPFIGSRESNRIVAPSAVLLWFGLAALAGGSR